MRKKSHISLANGLMNAVGEKRISHHKLTFAIASIWPDCQPSFVTTPHHIDVTFENLKKHISNLLNKNKRKDKLTTLSTAKIGVIMHYVADYFTFPHNKEFPGSLKDHCFYERDLKFAIRSYMHNNGAFFHKRKATILSTPQTLFDYIEKKHNEYINAIHTLEHDVDYIVQICTDVFLSLLTMLGLYKLA